MRIFLFIAFALSFSTFADGMIIPFPRPGIEKNYMALIDHYADISVINSICRVHVKETFLNPYEFSIEGEYIFPLPKGAAPSKFTLEIDGKEIEGEVLERDEARKIYEDIVRRMIDPALLEYYEFNLFRASIAPIGAKKEKNVTLRYEYELPRKGDFFEIFYPFKIEGLSPTPIKNAVISFNIESNLPIKQVFSPTHKINLKRDENLVKGVYEDVNVRPEKDFILYFSVSQQKFEASLLTYKKENEDGYFLLGLSTPTKPEKTEIIPKDIVFVMDVSGSMGGEKIEQAREGLNFILEHLNSEDRFNIISFSSDVERLFSGLVTPSEENIETAKELIGELEALGGTNINDALLEALKLYNGGKRPFYVIFLTDGLPTVGEQSIERILYNSGEIMKGQKVFSFGVGYDVNTILLDKLSEKGKGVSEYVEPGEELEIAISSLYSKIMYPAVEEPELKFHNIDVFKVHPKSLGDLFYGQNLIIAGMYKTPSTAQLLIKGSQDGEIWSFEKILNFPSKNYEMDFIPIIWSRKRVAYLLSEIRLHGENKELVDEIVSLGKKYGIVTPYTSYLVREDERRDIELAISAPEAKKATGASAVKFAKGIRNMGEKLESSLSGIESIKQIGEKVFYLKNETYIDGGYTEDMKLIKLKFGTKEYFDILSEYPEYSRYFGVAKNIIVVIKGIAYKVES